MNDIPEDIRSLLTEACSLDYCPEAVRAWCVEVLSTDSLPYLPIIHVEWGYRYWSGFTESVYWALHYPKFDSPGHRHSVTIYIRRARTALDDIIELYPLREAYVEVP